MEEPTQARLKELLFYDPLLGIFVRKVRTAQMNRIGDIVGVNPACDGYSRISVDGKQRLAHRLAWIITHGDISEEYEIDHENRNRNDNRISNLRLVVRNQNSANASIPSHNTSGYKGVYWNKRKKKWRAFIKVDGEQKHLGYFECKNEAAIAYNNAASFYFGEYANLNVIVEGA